MKKPVEKTLPPDETKTPNTEAAPADPGVPVAIPPTKGNGKLKKKKSAPRLTHKQVWLLYADVIRCAKADQVFDILARTFEARSDLGYWLHRIGHGKKISLGKKRDFVQYFRAVAHSLFQDTRTEV